MMKRLSYFGLNVVFSTHLLFVVTFLGWDFLWYSGDSCLLTFLISAFFFNVIFGSSEGSFFFSFFFKCHIWVCSHFWLCSGFFLFRFILVRGFFNVVRSFFKHFADTITVTVQTYFIDKPLFYCIYFFFDNLITPFG